MVDVVDKNQHIILGLLGQSLGHSLSPIIHQAFFDELGLSGRYDKIEVADPQRLPDKLFELAGEGYSGLNVTIPYKLTVLPSLAALDQSAELAGAVNTIKFDPQPTGFNTDISGLAEALSQLDLDRANFPDIPDMDGDAPSFSQGSTKALILGSGGAARAAVIALSTLGFKKLAICSRNKNNAQAMLDQLLQTAHRASLVQCCREAVLAVFDDSLPANSKFAEHVSVVINATPIGQKDDHVPQPLADLLASVVQNSQNPVFVDLVYGKTLTPLCRLAQDLGFARVEDGKEMLIQQARLAFKIWTGHLPEGRLARERLK